jgi:serine/threonine-protein kinase
MPIVGDVLAERYRLEAVLGVGGMASVYRAVDLRLDRQVAVKVLIANLAADASFAERFNREAGAMAGFSHPNVAAVYDVEAGDPATGREPFYVMEYCEGGSLADRLKAGPIPPEALIPIVAAIAEGLTELHRQGLVHRDIKPANILFSGDRPKLADFGVVWRDGPQDGEPLTLPGSTVGTLPYLAPELVAGDPPSPASDVYAFGVTIFLALTGQYPRGRQLSTAAPELGTGFDHALTRALHVDPAARPSPTELAAELAAGAEVWGVASPNAGAIAAGLPQSGSSSGVDMEAPTVVAVDAPVASQPIRVVAEPIQAAAVPRQSARPRPAATRSSRTGYLWPAIFVVAIVLAVLLLPRLFGGGGALPGASPGPSAGASPTASPVVSPTALPSTPGTILAALDQVDAAIAAARGGKDGLSGKDGNELAQLAATVRAAVNRGDLGGAASATQSLSDRARELTDKLEKPRRDALLAAIEALQQALAQP